MATYLATVPVCAPRTILMRAATFAVVVATLACPASAQPRPHYRSVDINLTPVPDLFAPTGPILYRPQREWTEWAPFTIPTYIGPTGNRRGLNE